MFIVIATHNTGHEEISDPVLITNSIHKAVEKARNIEFLGYEFYSDEIGVDIYSLKPGRVYRKEELKWFSPGTPPLVVIFYRRHRRHCVKRTGRPHFEDCWEEEWFDKELEIKFSSKK